MPPNNGDEDTMEWIGKIHRIFLKATDSVATQQSKYLSVADGLEDAHGSYLLTLSIIVLSSIVLAFVIWAALTQVKEKASAEGQVIPVIPIQSLQHYEGGTVGKVHVKNGQHVEQGQLLVELDSTSDIAELERAVSRKNSLQVDAERLRIFASGGQNIKKLENLIRQGIGHEHDEQAVQQLVSDEEQLFDLQSKSKHAQEAVLLSQIEQASDQIILIKKQKETLQQHIDLLQEEKSMYDTIIDQDAFSKRDYLRIQREVNNANGELIKLLGEEKLASQELQETKNRLSQLTLSLDENTAEKIGAINSESMEIEKTIAKLRDKVNRMKIFSPVAGIVKSLKANAGGVISPGGLILEVVPLTNELLAEVKVTTKDIGHVKVGDKVRVKVLTFDFARYGDVEGTLQSISPSTYSDEKGNPYYEALVSLSKNHAGNPEANNKLIPGMTVQADIITGQRTILQYLLKPIHSTMQLAFAER